MMKKLLIFIVSILILPNVLYAASFNMNCPSSANKGEKITCKITANIDDSITTLKGNFANEGLNGLTFTKNNSLNYTKADGSGFEINEASGISNKINSSK